MALNYWSLANTQAVICIMPRLGCTDSRGTNFDTSYNVDDSSCKIFGCTDSSQLNYDPIFTRDVSSNGDASIACIAPVVGCMVASKANYDTTANVAATCIDFSPHPPPAPPPPEPSADNKAQVEIRIEVAQSPTDLDNLNLPASVEGFLTTLSRRRALLEDLLQSGALKPPHVEAAGKPTEMLTLRVAGAAQWPLGTLEELRTERGAQAGRRLQSESTANWVAAADWQTEYRRR